MSLQARIYEFGTRARRERQSRRLRLQDVAVALGYSTAFLSNLERGAIPCRHHVIRDLGAFFEIDVSELLAEFDVVKRAAAELAPHVASGDVAETAAQKKTA